MSLRVSEIAQLKRAQRSVKKAEQDLLDSAAAFSPLPSTPLSDKQPEKPRRKPPKPKSKKRAAARASGRARRLAERRRFFLDLRNLPPDAVLTIPEWQTLNALSERQARRILASDDGPAVVWLSAKRRGVTVKANAEWQQARSR
jgi:hypothetical protein